MRRFLLYSATQFRVHNKYFFSSFSECLSESIGKVNKNEFALKLKSLEDLTSKSIAETFENLFQRGNFKDVIWAYDSLKLSGRGKVTGLSALRPLFRSLAKLKKIQRVKSAINDAVRELSLSPVMAVKCLLEAYCIADQIEDAEILFFSIVLLKSSCNPNFFKDIMNYQINKDANLQGSYNDSESKGDTNIGPHEWKSPLLEILADLSNSKYKRTGDLHRSSHSNQGETLTPSNQSNKLDKAGEDFLSLSRKPQRIAVHMPIPFFVPSEEALLSLTRNLIGRRKSIHIMRGFFFPVESENGKVNASVAIGADACTSIQGVLRDIDTNALVHILVPSATNGNEVYSQELLFSDMLESLISVYERRGAWVECLHVLQYLDGLQTNELATPATSLSLNPLPLNQTDRQTNSQPFSLIQSVITRNLQGQSLTQSRELVMFILETHTTSMYRKTISALCQSSQFEHALTTLNRLQETRILLNKEINQGPHAKVCDIRDLSSFIRILESTALPVDIIASHHHTIVNSIIALSSQLTNQKMDNPSLLQQSVNAVIHSRPNLASSTLIHSDFKEQLALYLYPKISDSSQVDKDLISEMVESLVDALCTRGNTYHLALSQY